MGKIKSSFRLLYGLIPALFLTLPLHADVVRTNASPFGGTIALPINITGQGVDATYGSNVVTNGTFTGAATGWTLGLGGGSPDWAYSANTVTHANGGGTTALEPTTPLTVVAGSVYVIGYTVTNYVAGTVTASIGGVSGAAVNMNTAAFVAGGFFETLTATTTGNLKFTPTTTFDGTIDTVTVQLVTLSASAFSIKNGATTYPIEMRISGSGVGSLYIGASSGATNGSGATFNIGLGPLSLAAISSGDFNIGLGTSALRRMTTGGTNTCVGTSCLTSMRVGSSNTCLGMECLKNSIGADNNTVVGTQAALSATGSKNTLIGRDVGQTDTGSQNTALGYGNNASTFSYCITLGYGADCTASNQGVLGGDDASAGITELYLGQGVAKASPGGITVLATGGSGSNNAGGPLTFAGGKNTGTAAGGDVRLQTSPSSSTGSTLIASSDRTLIRAQAKALTAATATSFVQVGIPALGMAGGVVEYCIQASDGTDMQSLCGLLPFSVVNKAGVETCTLGVTSTQNETLVASSSVSTLTNTFTCSTSPTNAVDLQANAASSLTETVLQIVYQVRLNGAVGTTTLTAQ